jgi:hypothetical protein
VQPAPSLTAERTRKRTERACKRREAARKRIMKRVPKPTEAPQIWVHRYDWTGLYEQAAPFMAEAGWTVASASARHIPGALGTARTEQTVTWQHPGLKAEAEVVTPPDVTVRCLNCGAHGQTAGQRCRYCAATV